jgi:hypothetical protein
MVVNMKVVDFDLVLDDMVIVDQVWLQKQKIAGGKVRKMLKSAHMTIIICVKVLRFALV